MYFFSDANKISIYVYVQPRVKREQLYKCADCQLITGMASTCICENKRTLKIDGNRHHRLEDCRTSWNLPTIDLDLKCDQKETAYFALYYVPSIKKM